MSDFVFAGQTEIKVLGREKIKLAKFQNKEKKKL
jgi:hypothetical protein